MREMFSDIFKKLNAIFLRFPVHSPVKRSFSVTLKERKKKKPNKPNQQNHSKTNQPTQTTSTKRNSADLQYKAASVFFGKPVNLCVITSVLGEVINPCGIADVPSITQTSQTSEYNVM